MTDRQFDDDDDHEEGGGARKKQKRSGFGLASEGGAESGFRSEEKGRKLHRIVIGGGMHYSAAAPSERFLLMVAIIDYTTALYRFGA